MLNFKNIRTSLDYAYSSLSSRILLCGAILLLVILFKPTLSYSRLAPLDPRDPYIHRTLTLDVGFNFRTSSSKIGDFQSKRRWSFGESYKVSIRGSVIDPRFMVYDYYTFYSQSRNSTNQTGSNLGLGIKSTIFRKFRFPVTLYEYRFYGKDVIRDSFGARSLLRFRRLPTTRLRANYDRTETDTNISFNSNYQLKMDKNIGPTSNTLNYAYSINDNGATQSNLAITNGTRLSRATKMNAVLAHNVATPSDISDEDKTSTGFTMSLVSRTSDDFRQLHQYAAYSSETTSTEGTVTVDGQSYNGGWNFALLKNLSTGGGISVSESNSHGISSESTSESFSAHWNLNYTITRGLSLVWDSSYRSTRSSIISISTDESSSEYFNTNMGVTYSRRIRSASFSSSYRVGYVEELSLPLNGGGTGLRQGISLGLGNLHYKKVYVNTSYNASRVDVLTGDIWSTSQSLSVTATPRYWTKYGSIGSSYRFRTSRNWRNPEAVSSHNLNFNARSREIRRTRGSASQNFSIEKSGHLSDSTNKISSSRLSISHNRTVMGGKTQLSFLINYRKHEHGRALNKRIDARFKAGYFRPLFRRVAWRSYFDYSRGKDLSNNTSHSDTSFANTLAYNLRSWSIFAEHQITHSSSKHTATIIKEQFMLILKRSFVRGF